MGGFGYGRRVCPGRYLADSSAWLAIAQVLAAFTIQPKRDTNDKDILPSLEYGGGVIIHPVPFEVDIVPRSPKFLGMVQQAGMEA